MKKILIIGAGIGQLPLIKLAKSKGMYVIAVSMKGDHPGLLYADEIFEADIYDRDKIVAFARDKKIDAVTSDQNDLTMPTVAYVAEKLGLSGNTFLQALAYSNKNIFRQNCITLNIPSPRHVAVNKEIIPEFFNAIPFPWIVKPEDSQSSIGVTKVNSVEEYSKAIKLALSKSKNSRAIVEEFFAGHEVVCEGFIYKGTFHLLEFADRRYFDLPDMMIPSQTVFPSTIPVKILDRIVEYEKRMAEFVNPSFGIVHAEYLINTQTEEIRVVESALRGGGVFISSHLIPLATGVDINNLLMDCVLGCEVEIEKKLENRKNRAAAYVCFYLPEGRIINVKGVQELNNLPFVKMAEINKIETGVQTEKMLHKGMRKGPILIEAENRETLEENITSVQRILEVDVQTHDNQIKGIIWS